MINKRENSTKNIVRIMIIILIFFVIGLILFGGCDYIPKHSVVKDIDRYGKYDKYVNECFEENFCGSLPKEILSDVEVVDYLYDYYSPLLDFPSFHIGLELHFSDSDYLMEYDRIKKLDPSFVTDYDDGSIVILSDNEAVEEYSNDLIHDGYFLYIEIVQFDKNTNNVRYIVAKVSDAAPIESDYIDIIYSAYTHLMDKG